MSVHEVEDFFNNEGDYHAWRPGHTFSQSPCAPIIKIERTKFCLWYSCELHKNIIHDSLVTLEHHMRYKEPEKHKQAIEEILRKRQSKELIVEAKIDEVFNKDRSLARARRNYNESFEERIRSFGHGRI